VCQLAQRLIRLARQAQVGFNVELGGYFSTKRNTMSIWGDTFLAQDQVVAYCKALLEVFRCGCTHPDGPPAAPPPP
jgi:sulfite reductase beta subunit-like hemoprotein